jgi:uncharacterized protein YacL
MAKLTKGPKKHLGAIIGLIIAILILVLLAKLAMAAFFIALAIFAIIGGVYFVKSLKENNSQNIS